MHDDFKKLTLEQIKNIMKSNKPILIDVRGGFRNAAGSGFIYRSL